MVRAKTLAALMVTSVALAGCVTVAPIAPQAIQSAEEVIFERNYSLGEEMTATVGESIVRVRQYTKTTTTTPTFVSDRSFTIGGGGFGMRTFDAGEGLQSTGARTLDGVTYALAQFNTAGPYGGSINVQIAPDGSVHPNPVIINGSVSLQAAWRLVLDPADTRFTPGQTFGVKTRPGDLNYEIVFTGQDGNAMRFQYREYTADNMARAAFSQDLSYPIGARVIRFRNLTIEVGAITADQITYRIISDESGAAPNPS